MLKNKFGMATRVLLVVLSVLMAVSLAACKKGDTIDPDQMNSAIQSAIDAANKAQAEKDAALASSIAADKAAQEAKDAANAASIAADKLANDEALKKAEEAAAAAKKAADEAAKKAAEQEAALKKAQDEAAAAKKAADEAAKKAADEAAKAAEKAAAEAAAKAAEEAAAAAKVQEELLKKAQEEAAAAKAAADAAAAQAAADKAALEAALEKALAEAEAAAKAASEAIAKAEAAASKADETTAVPETTVAPETTVVPETTKDPAIAALEEALKQALAEAEAAKKAASEALAKAEEAASKADETTVVPETTTKAPETTTQAPETTTQAPETTQAPVMEDKSDVLAAFSKLKTLYTYTNQSLYNADEYAELVLLFDKASNDLYLATTVDAATSIYNTLEVDAAAVRNVKNAAAEVAALVNALGDIETEVFTTQADMILEAQKAYTALKTEYASYFGYDAENDADDQNNKDTSSIATKLGVNVADLDKADAKVEVLKTYMATALQANMQKIYDLDARQRYDATADADDDATIEALIPVVYYQYRVLSVINGGDVDVADLEVAWETKINEDNERVNDYDKPTKWFTVEDLYNVYILPTLDAELTDYAEAILTQFSAAVDTATAGLYPTLGAYEAVNAVAPTWKSVSYDLNDIYLALSDELMALSFADDYKGTASIEDAKVDVATRALKAYIDAVNVYFVAAQERAIELEETATEKSINDNLKEIDEIEISIGEQEIASMITKLENDIAKIEAENAKLEADLESYKANVEAAAMLTYDELLNEDLADEYTSWVDLTDIVAEGLVIGLETLDDVKANKVAKYLYDVVADIIDVNFETTIKETVAAPTVETFNELKAAMVADLRKFATRLESNETVGFGDIFDDLKVEWEAFETDKTGYKNTATFAAIQKIVTDAADAIEAKQFANYGTTVESVFTAYADSNELVTDKDGKAYYFKNQAAYDYAVETYGYDVADYDTIVLVVNASEGLVSTTASDYPVQYKYYAVEKAIKDLANEYIAAYTAANAEIVKESSLTNIAKNANKKITDGKYTDATHTTAADKLYAATSGTLQTEIKTVMDAHTSTITGLVTNFKKNLNIETKTFWALSAKLPDYVSKGGFVTFMSPDTFKAKDYADAYDYKGFEDDIQNEVKNFYNRFYGLSLASYADVTSDVINNTAGKTSTVVELWNVKLAAVAKITEEVAKYKNTHIALGDGFETVVANEKGYAYGVTGEKVATTAQPTYVATYEAALDSLLDEAEASIMAIQIGKSSRTVITDVLGNVVTAKFEAIGNIPASASSTKFENKDGSKISYNMDKAKNAIQAYMNVLLGTTGVYAQANNAPAGPNNHYDCGNSAIFQQYNTHVLGNSYGYALVD